LGFHFSNKLFFTEFILTTVPSPCINWCEINPTNGFCRGCYRTLAEIAQWSELPESDKLKVCVQLDERRLEQGQ